MTEKRDIPKANPRKKRKPKPRANANSPWFKKHSAKTASDRELGDPVWVVDHPPDAPPEAALANVEDTCEEAEDIIERVWGENGTGELTKADEKFCQLNRIYIVLAAKARGIDLTRRFLDCVEKSYGVGMDNEVNPAVSLGSRKHVTETVGKLAELDKRKEDAGAQVINVGFHSTFNQDGTGTCTIGMSVRTSPKAD